MLSSLDRKVKANRHAAYCILYDLIFNYLRVGRGKKKEWEGLRILVSAAHYLWDEDTHFAMKYRDSYDFVSAWES
jgi:hypothetical protein